MFSVNLSNPYSLNVTFLYPLKTSGNPRFSDIFRGYRNVTLGEYGLNALLFIQIARLRISQKLFWSLINGIQYIIDDCWKITGIHLKFVYLVKLLSNRWATGRLQQEWTFLEILTNLFQTLCRKSIFCA